MRRVVAGSAEGGGLPDDRGLWVAEGAGTVGELDGGEAEIEVAGVGELDEDLWAARLVEIAVSAVEFPAGEAVRDAISFVVFA